MKRSIALLLAVGATLAVGVPSAGAATETVTSGPVTATFTYKHTRELTFEDLHLKIVRAGIVALDAPIASQGCEFGCWPGSQLFENRKSITLTDLDGDGEPEVLLDLYTGGAHCCIVTQVFALQGPPSDTVHPSYGRVEHNFLDPGYTLRDLNADGLPEFQSADGRFAYAISSYAGSGVPVQIWRFQHGDLEDVTTEFPALIRADSRHWWKIYRKYGRKRPPANDPGLGALAAWAGDEYRLGHGAKVQRELKLALRRGWLDSYYSSGPRTLRNLNTLLRQVGYR